MKRPHSYSSLSTWKKCPKLFHWNYVLGNRQPPNAAADRGTELHLALELFFKGGSYPIANKVLAPWRHFMEALTVHNPSPEAEYAVDQHWSPTGYEDPNAYARGKADLRHMIGNTFHVYDWKSGRIYPDHKQQGEMYLAMEEPHEFLVTHFVYLDSPLHVETRRYSKSDQMLIRAHLTEDIDTVNSATEYPATPSPESCKYCQLSWRKGGQCKEAV